MRLKSHGEFPDSVWPGCIPTLVLFDILSLSNFHKILNDDPACSTCHSLLYFRSILPQVAFACTAFRSCCLLLMPRWCVRIATETCNMSRIIHFNFQLVGSDTLPLLILHWTVVLML
jgi:hypothetical protein